MCIRDSRYGGKGVLRAVDNVNKVIAPAILGMSALNQRDIDHKLLDLDGTKKMCIRDRHRADDQHGKQERCI